MSFHIYLNDDHWFPLKNLIYFQKECYHTGRRILQTITHSNSLVQQTHSSNQNMSAQAQPQRQPQQQPQQQPQRQDIPVRNRSRACLRADAAASAEEMHRRDRVEARRQNALIEEMQAELSGVKKELRQAQQVQEQEQEQEQAQQEQQEQQERQVRVNQETARRVLRLEEGYSRVQAGLGGFRKEQDEIARVQKEHGETISRMVTRSSSKKKSSKKNPLEDIDKALQENGLLKKFNPESCKCRVRKRGGTESQCYFKATVNGCCKKHDKMDTDGLYGFYNEKRPESNAAGKPHQWLIPPEAYPKAYLASAEI